MIRKAKKAKIEENAKKELAASHIKNSSFSKNSKKKSLRLITPNVLVKVAVVLELHVNITELIFYGWKFCSTSKISQQNKFSVQFWNKTENS